MTANVESATSPPTEVIASDNLRSDVWKVFGFPSINGKIASKDPVICRYIHSLNEASLTLCVNTTATAGKMIAFNVTLLSSGQYV